MIGSLPLNAPQLEGRITPALDAVEARLLEVVSNADETINPPQSLVQDLRFCLPIYLSVLYRLQRLSLSYNRASFGRCVLFLLFSVPTL